MHLSRRHFLAGTALALTTGRAAGSTEIPRIVATTAMIADAVRQIGGDTVDLRGLMGPGVDPHSYRQTRTDIAAMAGADLVLFHGLNLEAQMEGFLSDLGRRLPVRAIAEGLPQDSLIEDPQYPGRTDPHVWMDPGLWAQVVQAVAEAMIAVVPQREGLFQANAAAHLAGIERLGSYARDVLASVPPEARVLVTAHDAFGYFGRAYGYEVEGIQGISTASEAGLNRIGELVDLLVERRIAAVFVETSVSDRNIRALIEGAAARGHGIRIGGDLFSDAMGAPGTYEGTWIGMIDHNVTTIAAALGGRAPDGGMDGRLAGL